MSHASALLAPKGRLKIARTVVNDGWPLHRAAERARGDGGPLLAPASQPRPHTDTHRTSKHQPGSTRRCGPHRIAYHLHLAHSTVGAVLTRFQMPLLRHLDQNTGLSVRRPDPHRYEHYAPSDLVHIDIKKLDRIPDGGGAPQARAGRRTT